MVFNGLLTIGGPLGHVNGLKHAKCLIFLGEIFMTRLKLLALATVAAIAPLQAAYSAAVQSGFNSTLLARGDDFFVGPAALGFAANYFGNTYSNTYISNNGYLTFGSGSSSFSPIGLGSGYSGAPIIAPFYADTDTRNLSSAQAAYGNGIFEGHSAFGATWNGVGYYPVAANKLNSFQVLLVDRTDTGLGNFDIVFNYDYIQWETGNADGGSNGLGGNSASVGYNAGQNTGSGSPAGTFYQFPGSQVNGALIDGGANSLAANTNVDVAGRYLFNVRNGTVTPPPPTGTVPEPATWASMVVGFGAIGAAIRRRRKVAVSFA